VIPDTSISYGRTKSGTRWFWAACELTHPQATFIHGWADTQANALLAARDAADRLAGDRPAAIWVRHTTAREVSKRVTAEARRTRDKASSAHTDSDAS
jgi:hypothetical protein